MELDLELDLPLELLRKMKGSAFGPLGFIGSQWEPPRSMWASARGHEYPQWHTGDP